MYWVYIIKSKKNNSLYIGSTANLGQRLKDHNEGKSRSTKRYIPWVPVYVEGYFSKGDALLREKNLKYFGKAYSQLKRKIGKSLQSA
ncbi:MAG: GIY-YIG nuclease family protein [Patescibacteria group bacterium]|nr:GIY-YIG nuclease family protein [Patescibacteria group bacterium]MDD5294773.1 GIY-YIG nuclease family protein [Patescibacteria group bacterium]MDD5554343.1 GIY-YIG nuclease family protein [Patescibacteria group bacterium]